MQEDTYKEVFFDQYCSKCVNKDKKEDEDPCAECLNEPVNLYSHKPVNWTGSKGNEDYVAPRPGNKTEETAVTTEDKTEMVADVVDYEKLIRSKRRNNDVLSEMQKPEN